MNHYLIRFNKSRGMEGRGTSDHVWRVFENGREYLFKHFKLEVHAESQMSEGPDWNISCYGFMFIDLDTTTAIIRGA
jgi:hypothetical protein